MHQSYRLRNLEKLYHNDGFVMLRMSVCYGAIVSLKLSKYEAVRECSYKAQLRAPFRRAKRACVFIKNNSIYTSLSLSLSLDTHRYRKRIGNIGDQYKTLLPFLFKFVFFIILIDCFLIDSVGTLFCRPYKKRV